MSPQSLSGDYLKPRYAQNCVLGSNCPNMVIRAYSAPDPRKLKILISFNFTRSVSLIPFQRAFNHYQEIILSHDMPKNVFLAQNECPNMAIWPQLAPRDPRNRNFDFLNPTSSISQTRFQWALNCYQAIILSQDMPKNVFWAENAQIWIFF